MKKVLLLLFFFLALSSLYSIEGDVGISIGIFGLGFDHNIKLGEFYFYGRLFNFMFQTEKGFGVTASPLFFFINNSENDNFSIQFVNMSLFYNFLKRDREYFILGPFVSISAVRYNLPQFVEFCSGLTFSLRNLMRDSDNSKDSIFDYYFFQLEFGYKYNHYDKHGYYLHAGIDLISILWLIGTGKEKDFKDYQKNH